MEIYNPISQNHLMRQIPPEINELCQPFFKKLNLNYFHYFRAYKDGSAFMMYNQINWHDCFFEHKFRPAVPLPNQLIQIGQYNLCLWKGSLPDEIVQKARECNVDHPFSIGVAYPNYFDSFTFGTSIGNDSIINTYLNSIDEFIQFTIFFKEQTKLLINKLDKNRVILPKPYQPEQITILDNLNTNLTIQGNGVEVPITMKELQILKLICRGLVAKEIASTLFRSPRTIEAYVNTLKRKLKCASRSEIIEIAIKNNINFIH